MTNLRSEIRSECMSSIPMSKRKLLSAYVTINNVTGIIAMIITNTTTAVIV